MTPLAVIAQAAVTGDKGSGEWRTGWRVVAGAMIGIGCGPGLYQSMASLFTPGLMATFGWSRGDIATASGIGLLGALAVPLLGRLTDRVGVRKMVIFAMLLLTLCYLALSRLSGSLWQLRVIIIGVSLTIPGTSAIVYGRLIVRRFSRHRGTALAFAFSGSSVLTVVAPPAFAAVIAAATWRGGFVALAALTLLIALPLVLLAIWRDAPNALELATPVARAADTGMTGRAARRDVRFWLLAASGLLINLATIGLLSQLVPLGIDRGLTPSRAALLITGFGMSQLGGRLVIGWLIDRLPPNLVAAGTAMLSAVGLIIVQASMPGFPVLLLGVMLAAAMNGAEHDLLPFFSARFFGLRAYGEIYGSLLMITLLGTALGIILYGRVHDTTGSYAVALQLAAAAMMVTTLAFLTIERRPRKLARSLSLPTSEAIGINVAWRGAG